MTDNHSFILTYILAVFGGLLGLHHLYLGRTQHALLWFTTFGGGGWAFLYEFLFLIKQYVREANEDEQLIKDYQSKMIRTKSPAWEIPRLCGQYLTAVFYGFITYYAFPDVYHENALVSLLIGCCSTLAVALGTQMVGTIGPRQCSFLWPLLGASLGMAMIVWRTNSSPSFNLPALFSSLILEWKIQWNPSYFPDPSKKKPSISSRRKRRNRPKHYFLFGLGALLFSTLFLSTVYHNVHVNINGQSVRLKDILARFSQSEELTPIHTQVWNIVRQLSMFYWQYGLKGIWSEIWTNIFSADDGLAYQALNLRSTASQSEIESQCRTLPRQWHPDRYRNPEEKQKAEGIFLNIQQACDRLSDERKRRQKLNTFKPQNGN